MKRLKYHFDEVTLLVTHFNRSKSLEHLLSTFKNLQCSFEDIVVSDDSSNEEHIRHLESLQKIFSFRIIRSDKNAGLGHNLNKGQDAVITPFTLYVQEDFIPLPAFPEHFVFSLNVMIKRPELDIVRFYSYIKYPYLKPYGKGFSEMYIHPLAGNYKKIFYYSDHPHLRRSSFFEKFGRYIEGTTGDKCEYNMCLSFIKKKGKGLFYNDIKGLFRQKNSSEEPSTMTRRKWTKNKNPIIYLIREIYRQLKYNFDLLFK